MIYDQTKYRISKLEKELQTLFDIPKHDPEEAKDFEKKIKRLRKKGPNYWIKYYDSAKKQRYAFGGKSKKLAEAKERELLTKLANGEIGNKHNPKISMMEVLKYFDEKHLEYLRSGFKQTHYLDLLKAEIGRYKFVFLSANPTILVDLNNKLRETKDSRGNYYSKINISNYFKILRAAINYYRKLHPGNTALRVLPNPVECIDDVLIEKVRKEYITDDEHFEKLLPLAPLHLQRIMTAAWETGLRKSEILSWQWQDINFEEKRVFFILKKQKDEAERCWVPMSKPLHDTLMSISGPKEYGHVFTYNGKPILDIKTSWQRLKVLVGVTKRFHDYKRSWNRRMTNNGHRQRVVALGQNHKTMKMSFQYNAVAESDIMALVQDTWK